MKKVLGVYDAPRPHWVGNGFPVRSLFSYHERAAELSPFLLLDYAGPAQFEPTQVRRGVGQHPHRGFETVTIVYRGEVAHKDSAGKGGTIGPGDVQWMTAGAGILHEEYHSEAFGLAGGDLEMVQLWVNLPAKDKMTAPGYQAITRDAIPEVALPGGSGSVRVIAGAYEGHAGPARTFSPMHVWDLRLKAGASPRFSVPAGWNAALVVLAGEVQLKGEAAFEKGSAKEAQLVVFDRKGDYIDIEASRDTTLLLLSGEPIDEPIAGYGPFVMNSREEIQQAMQDFQSGRFGSMA